MTNIVPYDHQIRLADAIAKSKLFGIQTPDQALALMALCEAEGLHPAIAVRDFHIIQGKPALKADAMLARFQNAGGKIEWEEVSDKRACASFTHTSGGSVTIDWDMDRAKRAELGGKDMWKKYPRQMLRARVISEGIRTIFPGVLSGHYSIEEVQDFDPPAPKKAKEPPPAGAVDAEFTEKPILDQAKEYADKLKRAEDPEAFEKMVIDNAPLMGRLIEPEPHLHARLLEIIGERRAILHPTPKTPKQRKGRNEELNDAIPEFSNEVDDRRKAAE